MRNFFLHLLLALLMLCGLPLSSLKVTAANNNEKIVIVLKKNSLDKTSGSRDKKTLYVAFIEDAQLTLDASNYTGSMNVRVCDEQGEEVCNETYIVYGKLKVYPMVNFVKGSAYTIYVTTDVETYVGDFSY